MLKVKLAHKTGNKNLADTRLAAHSFRVGGHQNGMNNGNQFSSSV